MDVQFERNIVNYKEEWLTPPSLIHKLGKFDLDPCAPINRPWDTATSYFTINDDGLQQNWGGGGSAFGAILHTVKKRIYGFANVPNMATQLHSFLLEQKQKCFLIMYGIVQMLSVLLKKESNFIPLME
jgi:hypothetical protein